MGFQSKGRKVAGTTSSSKWRNKKNICHGEKAKVFRLKNKKINQEPEGKVRRMIQSKKRNGIREDLQLSVDTAKGRI